MKIRAKEIAKRLGVSPTTVSLVMNNKSGVSETTRKKVIQAMKEVGYSPAMVPMHPKSKNGNIRFISYKRYSEALAGTAFFSELIEGIDREARITGYNLSVTYIDEKIDDVQAVFRMLKNEKPDGIMLFGTELKLEDVKMFKELGFPMVVVDNYFSEDEGDYVCIDNISSAYRAIEYLIHLGHTKIGYVHSSVRIHNFELRKKGVEKALREYGMELLPENLFLIEANAKDNKEYDGLIKIMKTKYAPTALFCDNDTLAYGAIQALKEQGKKVPEDVSVIGFDDMPFGEMMEPQLTTVHVFKEKVGLLAMRRMAERIEEKPPEYTKTMIGTKLVVRESVRRL